MSACLDGPEEGIDSVVLEVARRGRIDGHRQTGGVRSRDQRGPAGSVRIGPPLKIE